MRQVASNKLPKPADPLSRAQAFAADALERIEAQLSGVVSSTVHLIPEVSHHLIGSGGKRIRPTMLLLMARAAGVPRPAECDLAVAAELFHNASLLHDDVVDRGMLRRGVAAAPRVYGNSASVLVGDFLMARAFGLVVGFGDLDLLTELSAVIRAMAEGEVLQLVRSGRATLSLPHYEEIIAGKTAGLFAWSCRAGATVGSRDHKHQQAAAAFGQAFGMAFQITDDILDYVATPEQSGKDLANDLQQGKTTLPLLLACEADPELLAQVEAIAAAEPTQKQCLEIVRRVLTTNAIPRALDKANLQAQAAISHLHKLPASEAREILQELALTVTERVEWPRK